MSKRPVYKTPAHMLRLGLENLISNFRKKKVAGKLFSNPNSAAYDEDYLSHHDMAEIFQQELDAPGSNHPYFVSEIKEQLDG